MSFNRNIWNKLSFDSDKNPPWPCPTCEDSIRFLKNKICIDKSEDLPDSIRYLSKLESPDIGHIGYRFAGIFECDKCKLRIATLGYAHAYNKDKFLLVPNTTIKWARYFFPFFLIHHLTYLMLARVVLKISKPNSKMPSLYIGTIKRLPPTR